MQYESASKGDDVDLRKAGMGRARFEDGFFNLIAGDRSSAGNVLEVIDPTTGTTIATVPDIDQTTLNAAVKAAREAFPSWCATSVQNRKHILEACLNRIREHGEELLPLLTAELGRPLSTSRWELDAFTEAYAPALISISIGDEKTHSETLGEVTKRFVPLGVVCAISPWNAPVLLAYLKVFTALLTGNTVVLKPSPFAPLTVCRIADRIKDLIPKGVFNVITGGDALGPWMTAHPGFDKVTFTGSTETGKRVLQSASSTLKRVTLELGGNDPAIVLPDAEPEEIAASLFWSMFMLNGHACISLKRLFVPEALYPRMVAALKRYAAGVKTGDGFDPESDLGPVQNRLQFARLKAVWDEIKESGTQLVYQGTVPDQGLFFPVTILDNPQEDLPFVTKEVFGPIRSIFRYSDLDDAIKRANATPYGLGASVWGKNAEQLHFVADRLDAGTVWINQHANLIGDYPFSGHKQSGLGAEFGIEGLKAYCNVRVIAG